MVLPVAARQHAQRWGLVAPVFAHHGVPEIRHVDLEAVVTDAGLAAVAIEDFEIVALPGVLLLERPTPVQCTVGAAVGFCRLPAVRTAASEDR